MNRSVGMFLLVCIVASWMLQARGASAQTADLILKNGDIYTLEKETPWASAVVISGNKIIAVLTDDHRVEDYVGPNTRVIDLEKKFVVPGFVDAHTHFGAFCAQQSDANLMRVTNDVGLVKELERVVQLIDDGEWLTGGQWEGYKQWVMGWENVEEYRENRWLPNRWAIDAVTPNNPAFLNSYDNELYLANTAALKAAGLESETLEGMKVDDKGRATGLIYKGSPAIQRIRQAIKPKSERRIMNELRRGFELLARIGITEIHDMSSEQQMQRYVKLQESGDLTARVWGRPHLIDIVDVMENGSKMGNHPVTGKRDYFLRYGAFKAHYDGLMGSHGALLFEPYFDKPDTRGHYRECTSSDRAHQNKDMAKFDRLLKMAADAGFVANTHAIGPRGVAEALDAYQRLSKAIGKPLDRYRVIHAQTIRPQDLPRFKELNLIAEVNPFMIEDDMRWVGRRLGPERVKWSYPFRSLIDHGVKLTFGSDIPGAAGATFLNDPKYLLHTAVTRMRPDGTPEGGWLPEQKITIQEAIEAYTLNAAYAVFDEEVRGSIEQDKLADLVVIDRNMLQIAPDELLKTHVEMTIVDGKIVYQRNSQP